MSRIVESDGQVTGFCVIENELVIQSGKELVIADKNTGEILRRRTVFTKDGKARYIKANAKTIAVSDFCKLLAFDRASLEKIGEWTLGEDLSGDICGLYIDESFIYACTRNGGIARVFIESGELSRHETGEHSSWMLCGDGDDLLAGTVDGELMRIATATMEIKKSLKLSKQNLRSILVSGERIYVASQDKKLYIVSKDFKLIKKCGSIHKKMFDIAGESCGKLYTVCHPCCEIRAWSKELELVHTEEIRLRLSGNSFVVGDYLFLSSRNITGIEKIALSELEA